MAAPAALFIKPFLCVIAFSAQTLRTYGPAVIE